MGKIFCMKLNNWILVPINYIFKLLLVHYQGALFFGVDMLLLNCKNWLSEVTSFMEFPSLQLNDLIQIWKFGSEHGETSIYLCRLLQMIDKKIHVGLFTVFFFLKYKLIIMAFHLTVGSGMCCSKWFYSRTVCKLSCEELCTCLTFM